MKSQLKKGDEKALVSQTSSFDLDMRTTFSKKKREQQRERERKEKKVGKKEKK